MNYLHFLIYLLVNLVTLTNASHPSATEQYMKPWIMVVYSCYEVLSDFNFGYKAKSSKASRYTSLCSYDPYLSSVMICAADKFKGAYNRKFNRTLNRLETVCSSYGGVNYTFDQLCTIYDNSTEYILEYDSTLNYTSTTLYQPTRVNKTLVNLVYNYYNTIYFNFDRTSFLSGMLNLYFATVFTVFAIGNVIKRLGLHKKFNNKVINWYRANVSLPALFNGKHTDSLVWLRVFSTLVPTRIESVVVFGFICLNVLLATFHYDVGYTNSISKTVMLYEVIADRTALLAFGQIPLLIIFAGRNNILTSLTGIPYTSLIFYHKWAARAMWLNALTHSICWTAYAVYYGRLAIYASRTYWTWGIIATTASGLIIFQAFHVFRTMSYECFIITHIILVVIFIVGCWWHCYDMGWLEWIYTSWAVWGFDRLIRAIRMIVYGVHKAEVTYVGDDTFRVEVPHNKFFNPFPGSYAFLYFFTPSLFWQSHPFTLLQSVHKDNHITFYIKTKTGLTKRIMKQLQDSPNGTKTIRVCVEGPYGHRAPTDRYDKALFYAGGNGVPGPYAHVMDLSQRESSAKQEIKFLWVVRNLDSLAWFSNELTNLAMNTQARLDIYVTGKNEVPVVQSDQASSSSNDAEKKDFISETTGTASDDEKIKLTHHEQAEQLVRNLSDRVTFHYQRPDVDALILKEFTEETGPSIAVMSCAHPKMVDQIRSSVANHIQKSRGRVDLYEELQVW